MNAYASTVTKQASFHTLLVLKCINAIYNAVQLYSQPEGALYQTLDKLSSTAKFSNYCYGKNTLKKSKLVNDQCVFSM